MDSIELTPPEVEPNYQKDKFDAFQMEVDRLINRLSMEQFSDTPDFMLADLLTRCLSMFGSVTKDGAGPIDMTPSEKFAMGMGVVFDDVTARRTE